MNFKGTDPKVPEKLTLAIAEALAEVPEARREEFLAELIRASGEMVAFFEAYDTALVSEAELEQVPEKIGTYHIIRPIGEGSMGRVFEGWDPQQKRRVAIKTLAPNLFADAQSRERLDQRFSREAKIVGKLDHPHIVKLIEYLYQNQPYLILEFVDGETLAMRLTRPASLNLQQIITVIDQVTAALGHAHAAAVIHRDLKPANILLDRQQRVKLTDFGISRLLGERTLTRTGFLGTPIYAAPEQITGTPLDQRADLFALGLIVHQLVTGKHPFRGENIEQTLYNLANKLPRLSRPHEHLDVDPKPFESFMEKALAKSPAKRYQSTESFFAAFQSICDSETLSLDQLPSEEDL